MRVSNYSSIRLLRLCKIFLYLKIQEIIHTVEVQEVTVTRDPPGRMKDYTVDVPDGDNVSYSYDHQITENGSYVEVTDSLGRVSTVFKNKKGQVVKEVDAAGNMVEYQYFEGNLFKKTET
ncbi:MAG: hypothetical protein GY765_26695, partial [bacterium]|nr:hypothetical protein [bacterium]